MNIKSLSKINSQNAQNYHNLKGHFNEITVGVAWENLLLIFFFAKFNKNIIMKFMVEWKI